jgi:hypothetical protein
MFLKRITPLLIALIIVPCFTGLASSAGTYPIPPNNRKSWGYIDHTGQFVIPAQFDKASNFSCGAAAVAVDRESISDYNELRYDYIDKTGKVVSHESQARDIQLRCGLCPRKSELGWGYVNAEGKFIIAPRFEEAMDFSENLAPVTEKGVFKIIDTTGAVVWSEDNANLEKTATDDSDYVVVELKNATFYAFNKNGRFHFGGWFLKNEEITPAPCVDTIPTSASCGYIDRKGKWSIFPKFQSASHYSEGLAAVTENSAATGGEWCNYYIDPSGKKQLSLLKSVRSIGDFHDGIAWVYLNQLDPPCALQRKEEESACAFIDKSGNFVIPPKFTSLSSFSEGLVAASTGYGESQRWGFIDRQQHVVIPFKFSYASDFSEGFAAVTLAQEQSVASASMPTAREVDKQIRERILQICHPYQFSSFRIQLHISNGVLQKVTLRKGTGDTSLDTKLTAALAGLKLPIWSPELSAENYPNYVVKPRSVAAAFTSEDSENQKIEEGKRLRDKLSAPQEHADWKKRISLLEQYLALEMPLDDDSWSNECHELATLYRRHGEIKKARNISELAYRRSSENGWDTAEIAEEDGDSKRAETILKDAVTRFEKQNQGKLSQNNVNPWYGTTIVALADFYYRQRRFNDAEDLYRTLADQRTYTIKANGEKIFDSNRENRWRLALFYLDRGKLELFDKLFNQLLKEADSTPQGFWMDEHCLSCLGILKERFPLRYEKFAYLMERTTASTGIPLFGVIDRNGRFVVPAKFDALGWFEDGLAPARIANRWGYIDTNGKWKIFPEFAQALPFSEGLAAVSRRFLAFPLDALDKNYEKLCFIDKDGVCKLRTEQEFGAETSAVFSEGLAGVAIDTGVNDSGYIDRSGKIIVAAQFHEVPPFKFGIAKPSIATPPITATGLGVEQYSVAIPRDGTPLLAPRLDEPMRKASDGELLNPFVITLADVRSNVSCDTGSGAKKWGYQALDGSVIVKPIFAQARCYSESVAAVSVKNHWGYIDRTGTSVLTPVYDSANDFTDGLAIVNDNNKTHFIDHAGRDPFDGKYNEVQVCSKDRFAVSTDGGTSYQLIDRSGRKVTESKFSRLGSFTADLAAASPDGDFNHCGYINRNGDFVIKPIFYQVGEFHGDLAVVRYLPDVPHVK